MARFDTHFKMDEADIIDYVREKLDFFPAGAALECTEIGDGNINYVYRVRDAASGRSLIIKHADETLRVNHTRVLGTDRTRIEGEMLLLEGRLCPGMVPQVYMLDPVMGVIAMEDLSGHKIMRAALCEGEVFPLFAEHITTFMAATLLPTTDLCMDAGEKKQAVISFTNPALCKITEDLVFSDPFGDDEGRNEVIAENLDFAREHIYNNKALRLAGARLKNEFMNHPQALIHGDLHTGSVFITQESTKVIDAEFATYAPIGYDLGNVTANLLLAWGHATAKNTDGSRTAQLEWLERTVCEVTDLFILKFEKAWAEHVSGFRARSEGFYEWYLAGILDYAAGIAGCELLRRILGNAPTIDTTTIPDRAARTAVERVLLLTGRDFILHPEKHHTGQSYTCTLGAYKGKAL